MVNQLSVNTATVGDEHHLHSPRKDPTFNAYDETPKTQASTPGSNITVPTTRGQSDIRSPGMAKTPSIDNKHQPHQKALTSPIVNASNNNNVPIPDFITQTDRHGNASTPRSQSALDSPHVTTNIEKSNTDETTELHEKEMSQTEDDACDTLLESFRMMCCCLLPDTEGMKQQQRENECDQRNSNSLDGRTIRKMQITKRRISGKQGSCYGHVDETSTFHERKDIKLLPGIVPEDYGKKCLVLDLDETLVHSSFRAVQGADFVIPVQIEDITHYVYVAKRPGVDEFLIEMAKHYEIILYTASLNKYADPLLDLLDPHRTIRTRLFRESCVYYEGNYVKDLSILDRDLSKTIIVDNSPSSYIFHPQNAIDCSSFIDDPEDRELDQIASFLKGVKNAKDVRTVCTMWKEWPHIPRIEEEEPLDMDKYESREDRHVQ